MILMQWAVLTEGNFVSKTAYTVAGTFKYAHNWWKMS